MKIRIHKLQIARRTVQVLALCAVFAVPMIARYANYVAALDIDKHIERWEGSLQATTLVAIDSAFRALPGGEVERAGRMVRNRDGVLEMAGGFGGGPWSGEVAGLSMTDPLAAVETVAAQRRIDRVLWAGLLIPVLATLVLGRVFCSWICPMGLLLSITDRLRSLAHKLELPTANVPCSRATKFVLLAVGLVVAFVLGVPILGYIYPPAMITREAHGLVAWNFNQAEAGHLGFALGGLTWVAVAIAAIALIEVAFSPRWWCRYVCPGGALYTLIGAVRPVRVKLKESNCTQCGQCVPVCPMGLDPMRNRMGAECDSCGLCISHCDDRALSFGLWTPATDAKTSFETKPEPRPNS